MGLPFDVKFVDVVKARWERLTYQNGMKLCVAAWTPHCFAIGFEFLVSLTVCLFFPFFTAIYSLSYIYR